MTQLKRNLTLVSKPSIPVTISAGGIRFYMEAPDASAACLSLYQKYGFEYFTVEEAAGLQLYTVVTQGKGVRFNTFPSAVDRVKALSRGLPHA